MSYHIVSIDAPDCSLSCKDGQLTCKSAEGNKTIPLEDVAAVIITSFSVSIHSKLLLEAARHGVGLVICENFKPASLVLPANRSTDTLLTKSQAYITAQLRKRLWQKTVEAKCRNQHSLAAELAPNDSRLEKLDRIARSVHPSKESECAKIFWRIYAEHVAETDDFRRGRHEGGPNPLLNYGYAVLLSTILQNLFAIGLDPTFGIFHVPREQSTPLAYDLMEPFRPCVDWRVAEWIHRHPDEKDWQVTREFRQWVTAFPLEKVDWFELTLDVRGVIEGVIRSFRQAVVTAQSGPYKPWTRTLTKWAG
ncbi:type II CRISPR-associated endonuclease Cas1 [Luteolibacter pohnpeiensis]|uniref:CRISPR-associated endonuclease Cas1 n=1 Tax=Luteolibacter pohnpeiensis TaxID=454153 RepID=A0A934S3H2_9BACT|nr:type II CRISPR-associated endonuclease Cas1 [Luteolibacter pohnpeiensis]MBK1881218.1 type II CRISPR-associated endonuclease Cas1 [Luteolibacter pohnpeiensis]